jgi:hypothetical protein
MQIMGRCVASRYIKTPVRQDATGVNLKLPYGYDNLSPRDFGVSGG